MYGLPCEHGRLDYAHELQSGLLKGDVVPDNKKGRYQYSLCSNSVKETSDIKANTLEEFLFERYVAFVEKDGIKKYFRIWHEPWQQASVEIEQINDQLIPTFGWGVNLKLMKAHYSPGVYGVWMGKPLILR